MQCFTCVAVLLFKAKRRTAAKLIQKTHELPRVGDKSQAMHFSKFMTSSSSRVQPLRWPEIRPITRRGQPEGPPNFPQQSGSRWSRRRLSLPSYQHTSIADTLHTRRISIRHGFQTGCYPHLPLRCSLRRKARPALIQLRGPEDGQTCCPPGSVCFEGCICCEWMECSYARVRHADSCLFPISSNKAEV